MDSQTEKEYEAQLKEFENRKNYIEGCHVKPQYTALAHYFLIRTLVNAKYWNIVSDDDNTLQYCIFKMLADKFSRGDALYFTCQYEKNLSLQEAGTKFFQSRKDLKSWAKIDGFQGDVEELAEYKLLHDLKKHEFYHYTTIEGKTVPTRGYNPIEHPLPFKDEGKRYVNLISRTYYLSNDELARLIMQVNNRAINNYFQEIRRRISILERPLVTARGDGKSYIYVNYNPRYAQYILTIFRTFYNFCWATKSWDKRILENPKEVILETPAQRLGLTDKVFDIKDIIYFR